MPWIDPGTTSMLTLRNARTDPKLFDKSTRRTRNVSSESK
jgi:hypothetical protein